MTDNQLALMCLEVLESNDEVGICAALDAIAERGGVDATNEKIFEARVKVLIEFVNRSIKTLQERLNTQHGRWFCTCFKIRFKGSFVRPVCEKCRKRDSWIGEEFRKWHGE